MFWKASGNEVGRVSLQQKPIQGNVHGHALKGQKSQTENYIHGFLRVYDKPQTPSTYVYIQPRSQTLTTNRTPHLDFKGSKYDAQTVSTIGIWTK